MSPPARGAGLEEPRPAGAPIAVLVQADRDHVEFIREALGPAFQVAEEPDTVADGPGPRLVIVDSPAPELTAQIRGRWPLAKLVALTAGEADAVVPKPLEWKVLKRTVYTLLGLALPTPSATAAAVSGNLAVGLEEHERLGSGA